MHATLLEDILTSNITEADHSIGDRHHIQQNAYNVQQILVDNFLDIKRRNEAMLFKVLPPRVLARLGSTVMDIQVIISYSFLFALSPVPQLLNSITSTTNMDTIPFFDDVSEDSSIFAQKINTLLTWSLTPLQFGDHRPYAAVTLLRILRDRCKDRAIRRDISSPDDFMQDHLFEWLDESEVAGDEANLSSVARLFGKLVKDGLFEYAKYVQRLVARGEPGLSNTQVRLLVLHVIAGVTYNVL